MGFLEALGRAKPADDILGAVGKYANIQHTNAATQNVQANTALSAENLEMAKIKRNQEQYQLNKTQEQENQLNKVIDMTTHPMYLSLPDEAKKSTLEYFSSNGFTDTTGKGTIKDIQLGIKNIEGTPDLFKSFTTPIIENKKQTALQAYGALQQAQAKGDEKGIAQAQALYQKANEDYNASTDNASKHMTLLDNKTHMAGTIQQIKNSGGWDKLAPTSQAVMLQSAETGDIATFNKISEEIAKQQTSLSNFAAKQKIKANSPAKATKPYKVTLFNESTGETRVVDKNTDEYDNMVNSGEYVVQPNPTASSQEMAGFTKAIKDASNAKKGGTKTQSGMTVEQLKQLKISALEAIKAKAPKQKVIQRYESLTGKKW